MKMSFCIECGSELDENGKCPNPDCVCNEAKETSAPKFQKKQMPKFEFKSDSKDLNTVVNTCIQYVGGAKSAIDEERGKLIVPDCVDPDGNEKPIKQYDIARLQSIIKDSFAEGRLQITNKRILFRATGMSITGPTTMQSEFSIEEVGGVEIRKEPRFNIFTMIGLALVCYIIYSLFSPVFANVYDFGFLSMIIPIVVAALSVIVFYLLKDKHLLCYVLMCILASALPTYPNIIQSLMSLVVSAMLIISFLLNGFARNLVIRILSKGGSPAMEIRHKDPFYAFTHNEYTGFSQVIPGPDVDIAAKEINAVIRTIQHGQIS